MANDLGCRREQDSLCIWPICKRDPDRCFSSNPPEVGSKTLIMEPDLHPKVEKDLGDATLG
jgi:hypothetical protein